jgi:hypothetical protein
LENSIRVITNITTNKAFKKSTTTSRHTYFKAFCTRNPATIPMVVGRLAAHTPSFFNVFSSILEATINGGAH